MDGYDVQNLLVFKWFFKNQFVKLYIICNIISLSFLPNKKNAHLKNNLNNLFNNLSMFNFYFSWK